MSNEEKKDNIIALAANRAWETFQAERREQYPKWDNMSAEQNELLRLTFMDAFVRGSMYALDTFGNEIKKQFGEWKDIDW